MVTRESLMDDPDQVTYLIRWWISQSGDRYHRIRSQGQVADFIQDVWLHLLRNLVPGKVLPLTLATVITNHCQWTLAESIARYVDHYTPLRLAFRRKMRYARQVEPDDIVDDSNQAHEAVILRERDDALANALRTLPARHATVVRSRYGLCGEDVQTLEQIGRTLQVTRERVRQLENVAIRKLQHNTAASMLVEFVHDQAVQNILDTTAEQMQSTEYGAALYADLMEDVTSDTET